MRFVQWGYKKNPAIVCLHGFMGCAEDWEPFANALLKAHPGFHVIAPDLPPEKDISTSLVSLLDSEGLSSVVLVGYSLGGRLGLHAAIQNGPRFPVFVGISTTAGIEDSTERARRVDRDHALAARLAAFKTPSEFRLFLEEWWELPVFSSPNRSSESKSAFIHSRLKCDPHRLAQDLQRWSSGSLASLWSKLPSCNNPALYISGDADLAYTAIAKKMAASSPNAEVEIINGAGHQLLIEKPQETALTVAGFLSRKIHGLSSRGGGL